MERRKAFFPQTGRGQCGPGERGNVVSDSNDVFVETQEITKSRAERIIWAIKENLRFTHGVEVSPLGPPDLAAYTLEELLLANKMIHKVDIDPQEQVPSSEVDIAALFVCTQAPAFTVGSHHLKPLARIGKKNLLLAWIPEGD
jgi:hypothetical protein